MDTVNYITAADKGRVYTSIGKMPFPIISSNVDSCERKGIGCLCSSILIFRKLSTLAILPFLSFLCFNLGMIVLFVCVILGF